MQKSAIMQNFRTTFKIPPSEKKISIYQNTFLMGSCFAENMHQKFEYVGFNVLSNPFGIIYNPLSVAECLVRVLNQIREKTEKLHKFNGVWHSWHFHSRYSGTDMQKTLDKMHDSVAIANQQLCRADWVFLTFGSAYAYFLKSNNQLVNNCHKYPAENFERRLLQPEEMAESVQKSLELLFEKNPKVKIVLTISPVRYLRDGVVENQSSKARLIYLKDLLMQTFPNRIQYFPAYELMMDDLRDYRL